MGNPKKRKRGEKNRENGDNTLLDTNTSPPPKEKKSATDRKRNREEKRKRQGMKNDRESPRRKKKTVKKRERELEMRTRMGKRKMLSVGEIKRYKRLHYILFHGALESKGGWREEEEEVGGRGVVESVAKRRQDKVRRDERRDEKRMVR